MYMIYKVNELRSRTREILNRAEAGDDIIIDRHGVRFVLRLDQSPSELKNEVYPGVFKGIPEVKSELVVEMIKDWES